MGISQIHQRTLQISHHKQVQVDRKRRKDRRNEKFHRRNKALGWGGQKVCIASFGNLRKWATLDRALEVFGSRRKTSACARTAKPTVVRTSLHHLTSLWLKPLNVPVSTSVARDITSIIPSMLCKNNRFHIEQRSSDRPPTRLSGLYLTLCSIFLRNCMW